MLKKNEKKKFNQHIIYLLFDNFIQMIYSM